MIGLHETMSAEGAFRLSDISSIRTPSVGTLGQVETREMKLDGGRSCRLLDFEVRQLMQRPVQLLPAEPGTKRCYVEVNCGDPIFWTDPVIAWALCVDGHVRPVTPMGVQDGITRASDDGLYLQMPDGSVCGIGEDCEPPDFTSVEEMIAYRVDQRDRRRAAASSASKEQDHGA